MAVATASAFALAPRTTEADTAVFSFTYNGIDAGGLAPSISSIPLTSTLFVDGNFFSYEDAPGNYTFTLPQFDSSWGTLTNTHLSIDANVQASFNLFGGEFGASVGGFSSGSASGTSGSDVGYENENLTASAAPYDFDLETLPLASVSSGSLTLSGPGHYTINKYRVESDSPSLVADGNSYAFTDATAFGFDATLNPGSPESSLIYTFLGSVTTTLTYTYTAAPGGPGGPGGGGGGGGGIWSGTLPTTPVGGFGLLRILLNDNVTVSSTDVPATGILDQGILNQTGANLTISGAVELDGAYYDDGTTVVQSGAYNLSGGTASFGSMTSTGIVTQTGGSLTSGNLTQTGSTSFDPSNGQQYVGGVYNLSNGTASLGDVTNNGIINQSGGNLTATSFSQTDSAYTALTVSNGTPILTTQHFGVFNQSSGTSSLGNVTGNGTINISGNATMSATSFAIGGTFNQTGGTSSLGNVTGNSTISIGGNATMSATHFAMEGGVFNQTGGTSSLGNVAGNSTITIGANATMTAAALSMPSGSLTVNGNATVSYTSATRQDTGVVINIGNLTIGSTGILNVTNHDLIIGNSNLTTVQDEILNGFGAGPGGAEITSSTAIADGDIFLVPLDVDALGIAGNTFDGITIPSGSILVKYDYFGDVNFDGVVNGDDITTVESNFNATTPGLLDIGTSWLMGDADLNGIVDGNDISTVESYWGLGSGTGSAGPLVITGGSVPEPASLGVLAIGTMALVCRRKGR